MNQSNTIVCINLPKRKKPKKSLKKDLTKCLWSDIMTKLSRETARLVLENWTTKSEVQSLDIDLSRTTELVQFLKTQKRKLTLKKNKSARKAKSSLDKICTGFRVCGYRIIREFDPGSGLTLAACITHSSRTNKGLRSYVSGGRVSNAWATCLCEGDNYRKQ